MESKYDDGSQIKIEIDNNERKITTTNNEGVESATLVTNGDTKVTIQIDANEGITTTTNKDSKIKIETEWNKYTVTKIKDKGSVSCDGTIVPTQINENMLIVQTHSNRPIITTTNKKDVKSVTVASDDSQAPGNKTVYLTNDTITHKDNNGFTITAHHESNSLTIEKENGKEIEKITIDANNKISEEKYDIDISSNLDDPETEQLDQSKERLIA